MTLDSINNVAVSYRRLGVCDVFVNSSIANEGAFVKNQGPCMSRTDLFSKREPTMKIDLTSLRSPTSPLLLGFEN